MDPRTKRNLIKEELGMEICAIVQRPFLTLNAHEMRKDR
jgi:hypothetical protein